MQQPYLVTSTLVDHYSLNGFAERMKMANCNHQIIIDAHRLAATADDINWETGSAWNGVIKLTRGELINPMIPKDSLYI